MANLASLEFGLSEQIELIGKKGVLNPIPPYFLCQPAKYSDRPTTLHLYGFISLYPHPTVIELHIYDRT